VQTEKEENKILGILGGVGPRASAEFLKTIYEHSLGEREQNSPRVLMYSDPSFPDRTETFLTGDCDVLLKKLIAALNSLRSQGVSRIVICCVTIHYLLPRLPEDLRTQITSLIDVVLAEVRRSQKKHLLICTKGARRLKIFQGHPQWELSKDYLLLPDESDQESIHYLIYQIKRNEDIKKLLPFVDTLLAKYKVDSFVAGCTEMHVLAKQFHRANGGNGGYGCLDPLTIIAEELAEKGI
jgi:aspartate racemase